MPSFANHHSSETVKLLLLGNRGEGKTGALACLANAGYRLVILDFDNGLDILGQYLTPEAAKRVFYFSLTDKMCVAPARGLLKGSLPRMVVKPQGEPRAFVNALQLLSEWKTPTEDLGKPSSWGPDTILVLDSLTFASAAALRYILYVNNKSGEHPSMNDLGNAMSEIEGLMERLYSTDIKCNVIMLAHIVRFGGGQTKEIDPETGERKLLETDTDQGEGWPSTLGRKLPPKIGGYFNTVVRARCQVFGASEKRTIETKSHDNLILKSSRPNDIPASLPLDTGLATIFKILRGDPPKTWL